MRSQIHATSPAPIIIPTWTRQFVTMTTLTDNNQLITRYTGWRAVIHIDASRRYTSYGEVDVNIVANDQAHDCDHLGCAGVHGSRCASNASNLLCASVSDAVAADDHTAIINNASTLVAEWGFRVDGPWVSSPDGTYTAPLIPVILDPNCAAYEPATAAAMPTTAPAALVAATATALLGTEPAISETNPCGASLSARCFNSHVECATHPTREMLEAAWERVDPEGVAALRESAAKLAGAATRPYSSPTTEEGR